MNVSLTLSSSIAAWAAIQPDPHAAILAVLQEYVDANSTPLAHAIAALKKNASTLPENMEFEIPQIIGHDIWKTLDRSHIGKLGKQVKADPVAFGLQFVRTTTSRHAVYKKFTMVVGLKPPVRGVVAS
jgi:hypothetical protein